MNVIKGDAGNPLKKLNMKQIILSSAIVIAAFVSGCENYKDELAQMTAVKDSVLAVSSAKDKSIEEFMTSFEEIESNLAEITSKENTIKVESGNDTEMNKNTRELIHSEIASIQQLMEDSKMKVEELNKKLKNSNFRIAKFEKMIASLNEQIAMKDSQLVNLNTQLVALNTQVEGLNSTVSALSTKDSVNTKVIETQTNKMNTAYIAIGNYKKLRDTQVVTKEGGFLGLGKEEKLSTNLNSEAFQTVDITRINNIPLDTKDAKLVTVHPAGSYSIEKQNDKVSEIKITDAEKFWSTSKYLVVMTK
jgi:predicted  nucleic acid-binding Zn-ribbon protein